MTEPSDTAFTSLLHNTSFRHTTEYKMAKILLLWKQAMTKTFLNQWHHISSNEGEQNYVNISWRIWLRKTTDRFPHFELSYANAS